MAGPMAGPRLPRRTLLAAALLLAACRGGTALAPAPAAGEGTAEGGPIADPGEAFRRGAIAEAAPGDYETDPRVRGLIEDWPAAVGRAVERLGVAAGIGFDRSAPPRVLLAPLGDERRAFLLAAEVAEGRRRPVVRVNLEPLAAGRETADRLLLDALSSALFEETSARADPVPSWVPRFAATAAAGDLDERIGKLRRRLDLGDGAAARVDPTDPAAAEATGLAALCLLLDRHDPAGIRRFLSFVAEGDPPDALLARTIQDPEGTWVGSGRRALEARLPPPGPWRTVRAAEEAIATTGRAGLLALLPEPPPEEIADEARYLLARAAAEEGDWAEAESRLVALGPDAPSRLRDPGGAARLWIETLRRRGAEDPADRLAAEFRRDYPWNAALLGIGGAGQAGPDPRTDDLAVVEGHLARLLVEEHRIGAARRYLDLLGERATAPEIAGIARAVAEAEREPSEVAVAANRARVEAWRAAPGDRTEQAVVDGGSAAAVALAEVLPDRPGEERRAVLSLLARAGGTERAVGAAASAWSGRPDLVAEDLALLVATLPYEEVRVFADGAARAEIESAGGETLWERARLGLDEEWVRGHLRFLRDLSSPQYAARRAAFDLAVAEGQAVASPLLIARMLRDPATLLRRDAAVVAGEGRFRALLAAALEDPAWSVRAAAASGHRSLGTEAFDPLLRVMREDPSAEVRLAAAHALMDMSPGDPRLLDAVVATLGEEAPRVREDLLARWRVLPRGEWGRALARGLAAESARRPPRTAVLSRLFLAFGRVSGRDLGYHPGLPEPETARLVEQATRLARNAP
jgi:hypothetical protein